MKVKVINHTPLWVAAQAIRTCWDSHDKSDTMFQEMEDVTGEYNTFIYDGTNEYDFCVEAGTNDKALIDRVGNKFKHSSTLEHITYNITIDGVSRALLQELARHRMSSFSVKSTRYTLKELKDEPCVYNTSPAGVDYHWDIVKKYCVMTGNNDVDTMSARALSGLQSVLQDGISNDRAKYCLPESYKTSLTWSVNARSLQNFLRLRSSKAALWEIRDLAQEVYNALPEEHKYLFSDCLAQEVQGA